MLPIENQETLRKLKIIMACAPIIGLSNTDETKWFHPIENYINNIEALTELYNAEKVILRYEEEIPREIDVLANAKTIQIDNDECYYIPREIGNLINLESLIIFTKQKIRIPDEICNLVSLKSLEFPTWYATPSKIQNLPENLGNLVNLEYLSLNGEFEAIPKSIFQLKKLTLLKIKGGCKKIPESLGNLTTLEYLNISCKAKKIPNSIGKLVNLEYLNLEYKLEELPKTIGNLRKLETFYVRSRYIKSLPKEIYNLKQLKKLDITGERLFESELEGEIYDHIEEKLKKQLPNCDVNVYCFE